MYKVTIGITTFNLSKYIAYALDSILSQITTFDFKILVVDDASIDDTQAILRDYKRRHPDKIDLILKEKNGGSLETSNILFNSIKTEYFSFLDGDDYWLDNSRLQKQVDFLDAHREYSMVGGNTLYLIENENKVSNKVIPEAYLGKSFEWKDKLRDCCPFVHTSSILYRNVIYMNGMPKEYISAQSTMDNSVYRGEDIRFLHHLNKGKLYLFNEDFSVYRIHQGGLWTSSTENKKILEGMIANLKYMAIFPDARIKWNKDFVALYRKFFSTFTEKCELTDKESDYLQYILQLLKHQKIDWLPIRKPTTLKQKVLKYLYIRVHRYLSKKGLLA